MSVSLHAAILKRFFLHTLAFFFSLDYGKYSRLQRWSTSQAAVTVSDYKLEEKACNPGYLR